MQLKIIQKHFYQYRERSKIHNVYTICTNNTRMQFKTIILFVPTPIPACNSNSIVKHDQPLSTNRYGFVQLQSLLMFEQAIVLMEQTSSISYLSL